MISNPPVFEVSGFKSSNTIVFADVMIPAADGKRVSWEDAFNGQTHAVIFLRKQG